MAAIHLLASGLVYCAAVLMLVGLFFKPWIVLWWLDRQNRLMVIKYYGTLLLIAFIFKILSHG